MSDAIRAVPGAHRYPRRSRRPTSAQWEGLVATFAQFAYRYGFSLVMTPMFEDVGVFMRGIGEESDVFRKEMYVFEDRGGRRYALRPEGTASVVRAFVQHQPDDALEGVVPHARLSLREAPEGSLPPALPVRRRGARAPTTRPSTSRSSPWRTASIARSGSRRVTSADQLHGPRRAVARPTSSC